MAVDLTLLAGKVRRYREQFALSLSDVAASTGISSEHLELLEAGKRTPSGDEILILADFFKCDYRFLISNEQLAPIEQTEKLFRKHGNDFSPKDRWAVQECLFLCECESFLERTLGIQKLDFTATKVGNFFKRHGEDTARLLRQRLSYDDSEIPSDVFGEFRRLGIHLFRRKLENSNVSGVFLKHPTAGNCVIVNYLEDTYRQRFTATHEAGHALLDTDVDFVVSFEHKGNDLREVRANTFASHFLLPAKFFERIASDFTLTDDQALEWANRLKVNTVTLAIRLFDLKLIDEETRQRMSRLRVAREAKTDPELSETLSEGSRQRKRAMLERGLSDYYVKLCFEAYQQAAVSAARLGEMLLVSGDVEVREIASMYGEQVRYGD